MNFYRKYWYYIDGIYFIVLTFIMGFWGNQIGHIQIVLIYSFMALLIHQLEEYAFPGGFPAIFNIAVLGEREVPEKYPLNANQCLVVNVFLTYPFYIIAILFPNIIWLGIVQVVFGMFQIIVHGIIINLEMKSIYNPGLAAVVFLHWPIGIYYLWYISSNKLANTKDYIFGLIVIVIVTVIVAIVIVALPVKLLGNKNSKYPFSEIEFIRFGKKKLMQMTNL